MKDQNQNVISKSNVNNSITYTGRRYDQESELYYYRNRMYSPTLGRFMQRDPKGYVDGMNLYAYVKNNPLKYLDAMGTTAVQRFDGGYVSYSISGRTDDYSVSYDNNSGFGNSGSTNYSHDNSGQYTTQNNLSGMSNANWDDGSYQEFNNGIGIYKENGSSPVVFNPSLDILREEYNTNKYATSSYPTQPTEYQKAKATSKYFGDISQASALAGAFTGFPGFGLAATITGAISYTSDPDKSLKKDFQQASDIFNDLHERTRGK